MKKVNSFIALLYINNLILIIANLLFIVGFLESFDTKIFSDKVFEILLLWSVVFLIISIVNIISIVLDYRNNNSERLLKKMKRVKFSLIPFWIINFICYIPISSLLLVIGHGFGFFIVPIFMAITYIVLLFTSIFSISYLLNIKKNKRITNWQFIGHSILQLCFIIDIIDTIYIASKWGRNI